jgi:hypothetical protein
LPATEIAQKQRDNSGHNSEKTARKQRDNSAGTAVKRSDIGERCEPSTCPSMQPAANETTAIERAVDIAGIYNAILRKYQEQNMNDVYRSEPPCSFTL